MELALLALIASVIGGGVTGALLVSWGLHRRTYSLECQLTDVQKSLVVEVKKRAGTERWKQKDLAEQLVPLLQAKQAQEKNPWDL